MKLRIKIKGTNYQMKEWYWQHPREPIFDWSAWSSMVPEGGGNIIHKLIFRRCRNILTSKIMILLPYTRSQIRNRIHCPTTKNMFLDGRKMVTHPKNPLLFQVVMLYMLIFCVRAAGPFTEPLLTSCAVFRREKRFYNRETNSMAFCVIQQMFIKPPFPSMQLK